MKNMKAMKAMKAMKDNIKVAMSLLQDLHGKKYQLFLLHF
jgi:hypothetical protein